MWRQVLTAFGLVLVLEGILPFLSPGHLRKTMTMASQLNDNTLRVVGFCSMIVGLLLLYLS